MRVQRQYVAPLRRTLAAFPGADQSRLAPLLLSPLAHAHAHMRTITRLCSRAQTQKHTTLTCTQRILAGSGLHPFHALFGRLYIDHNNIEHFGMNSVAAVIECPRVTAFSIWSNPAISGIQQLPVACAVRALHVHIRTPTRAPHPPTHIHTPSLMSAHTYTLSPLAFQQRTIDCDRPHGILS